MDNDLDDDYMDDDFMFWGGFLGINIDEEREEKRGKKKKRVDTDSENGVL